jgi:hypothetical protein
LRRAEEVADRLQGAQREAPQRGAPAAENSLLSRKASCRVSCPATCIEVAKSPRPNCTDMSS